MPFQQLLPPSADMQASGRHGRGETDWWLRPAGDGGGWPRYRQCQRLRLCTVLMIQAVSLVSPLLVHRMQSSNSRALRTNRQSFLQEWFSRLDLVREPIRGGAVARRMTISWQVTDAVPNS